jgi:uncharacterized protein
MWLRVICLGFCGVVMAGCAGAPDVRELPDPSEPPAVVNASSCAQLQGSTKPFLLILDRGDELLSAVSQCAKAAHLSGASVSGIGQLFNPELAYFINNDAQSVGSFVASYEVTQLKGYYELASVNGNVASNGGKYFVHLHAVLGDDGLHGRAGHVILGPVGLTAEITIVPLAGAVAREVAEDGSFGRVVH